MFVEIKELPLILEYANAGLLYDSAYYAEDSEHAQQGDWDGPLPTKACENTEVTRRFHSPNNDWKFYIYLEE